jgi:hypothetical protein
MINQFKIIVDYLHLNSSRKKKELFSVIYFAVLSFKIMMMFSKQIITTNVELNIQDLLVL